MRASETTDLDEIRAVICHPEIYPLISDDECPPADDFEIPLDGFTYIAGFNGGELVSMMVYHQFRDGIKLHMHVLPGHRNLSREFGSLCLPELTKHNLPVYAEIPEIYENVIKYSIEFGFEIIDTEPKAYLKGGQRHDVFILRLRNGIY